MEVMEVEEDTNDGAHWPLQTWRTPVDDGWLLQVPNFSHSFSMTALCCLMRSCSLYVDMCLSVLHRGKPSIPAAAILDLSFFFKKETTFDHWYFHLQKLLGVYLATAYNKLLSGLRQQD